jgi:hypothetical protein
MIVRTWNILLLFLVGSLLPVAPVNATSVIPTFDTQWSTARATYVVRLTFDQKTGFSVKEILKGANNAPAQWNFEEDEFRKNLGFSVKRWNLKNPIEMIAFLRNEQDGKWHYNYSEFVFLQGNTIHSFGYVKPDMTRHTLLAALREAESLQLEFNVMLSRPMTRERLDELISFLLKHANPENVSRYQGDYFMENAKRQLGMHSPQASSWILERLVATQAERELTTLIELVRGFPPTDSAFETIAGFLDHSHTETVRRAAIRAVRSIDSFRALDLFIPYLTPDEPELASLLTPLNGLDSPSPLVKNPVVVKPLAELVRAMRSTHVLDDPNPPGMAYFLLSFLSNYNHPRHIPLLVEWATDNTDPAANNAMFCLAELSGLPVRRNDANAWRLWWERNKSVLDEEYDLSSAAGLKTWLEASEKSDSDIRQILMKLWTFEPTIPEDALIEEAENSEIARNALADLWHKDRLSVSARRSLVKQHLSFHLVRVPTELDKPFGNFYSVRIAAKSNFPFPAGAIIHYRGAIALNGDPELKPFRTSFSLHRISSRTGLSTLTGFHADRDQLNAMVQLKEIDEPWRKSALLWELEWKLEPLTLRSE